jgi:flagellar biosynthesis protein
VDITDNNDAPKKETPEQSRRAAAVALKKYGIDEGSLPKVVAAGYGKLAEQIVEIAFQNGVKVREDKDLAQMLAAIELDSDIPSEALIAVAEILAYVYKVNGTYQSIKPETQTGHPPKEQADDTEQ